MAKNYFYEGKVESRFLDLTIVCNLMYSSGPPDLAGVFRRINGESDAIEKAEETHDETHLHRVATMGASGARSKKKGDKPQVCVPDRYACMFSKAVHLLARCPRIRIRVSRKLKLPPCVFLPVEGIVAAAGFPVC
jgi:hypothetical protein